MPFQFCCPAIGRNLMNLRYETKTFLRPAMQLAYHRCPESSAGYKRILCKMPGLSAPAQRTNGKQTRFLHPIRVILFWMICRKKLRYHGYSILFSRRETGVAAEKQNTMALVHTRVFMPSTCSSSPQDIHGLNLSSESVIF